MNESTPHVDTSRTSAPERSSFLDDLFTDNADVRHDAEEQRFIEMLQERQQR